MIKDRQGQVVRELEGQNQLKKNSIAHLLVDVL